MIDRSDIIPIIPGLIPGLIAIIVAYMTHLGQKKTQKEVVELGHKLTQERFLTEKSWNERRCLYAEISRIVQDFCRSMYEISGKLTIFEHGLEDPGNGLHCLALYYIYDKYLAEHQRVQWDEILQNDATENEKKEIDNVNVKYNIQLLWNKLFDMRGDVTIFATEDIKNLWKDLLKFSNDFLKDSKIKVGLLSMSSRKRSSDAETKVGEVLNGKIPRSLRCLSEINLLEIAEKFNTKINELHFQMRKDLGVEDLELKKETKGH